MLTNQFLMENLFNKPKTYKLEVLEFINKTGYQFVVEVLSAAGRKLKKVVIDEELVLPFRLNKPEFRMKIWRVDYEKENFMLIGKIEFFEYFDGFSGIFDAVFGFFQRFLCFRFFPLCVVECLIF